MTKEEFLIAQPIPNEDSVYRQTHFSKVLHERGNKKKRFPSESNFVPDKDGLSVNWNRHITIDGILCTIGLSQKLDGNFKNFADFKIFSISVEFLRNLDGIEEVIHTPVWNGNPAPVGRPNIYSHSSVIYPNDEEIRVKLSDYCCKNHLTSYCPAEDLKSLEAEIKELRARLDDTPYHRLPVEKYS